MKWRIEGHFDSNDSLSILNKNFALAMSKTGQDVELYSTEGPGDFTPCYEFLQNNPRVNKLYQKSKSSKNDIFITSRNLFPPRVDDFDSQINLLHAYGWEESAFPSQWVDNFNKSLTGLTVMSNQVKKILIDNGVSLPIKVCGLGVDHIDEFNDNFKYQICKKAYAFLHISSCFPRKGIDCLLKSYGRSFSNSDDVTLIIKTFKNEHNNIDQILTNFYSLNPNFPDVNVIDSDLTEEEIKSLYLQSDVLVAPSRGEGFNLTVAEAMRLGLPVITTDWGGQKDFCNQENSWLIDYEFEYSNTHLDTFSSVWANPSDIHLSQLMKEVYDSSLPVISNKVKAAKLSVSKYTWENVVNINQDFVTSLRHVSTLKTPIIGVISTWKSRCGIATYTEHLFSNIDDEYIIFSPYTDHIPNDTSIRCWDLGDDDLINLFENIINKNITTIVIQFNYGFFDFVSFSNFLKKVSDKNINIILTLHSTIDPKDNPSKKISLLSNELALCKRVLVHSVSDLNRLKDLNLIDNVSLFPHGILESNLYKRKNDYKKYKNQELHFSTFGFCLPNKGFEELIKAISILRNDNILCRLTLYTSLYDSKSSYEILNNLNLLIHNLNIKRYVQINSSFLTDDEIFSKLSNTDLVVFPYQSTNESASGAARQAISAMVPVAVTPLSIFNDITDVVYTLPGCSSASIASGLVEWLDNYFGIPMSENEISWREQHSYKVLSYRLKGMIRSLEMND